MTRESETIAADCPDAVINKAKTEVPIEERYALAVLDAKFWMDRAGKEERRANAAESALKNNAEAGYSLRSENNRLHRKVRALRQALGAVLGFAKDDYDGE